MYATFQCTISVIDEPLKEALSHDLYRLRKQEIGGTTIDSQNGEMDDEDVLVYESIAPGLPAASSDRRKWWLSNGYLAPAL